MNSNLGFLKSELNSRLRARTWSYKSWSCFEFWFMGKNLVGIKYKINSKYSTKIKTFYSIEPYLKPLDIPPLIRWLNFLMTSLRNIQTLPQEMPHKGLWAIKGDSIINKDPTNCRWYQAASHSMGIQNSWSPSLQTQAPLWIWAHGHQLGSASENDLEP